MKKLFFLISLFALPVCVSAQNTLYMGDMNSDGNINVSDVSSLLDCILKGKTAEIYTISAASRDMSLGTVSGSCSVVAGNSATVTASAAAGYKFNGWYDGTTLVSESNPYTFTPTSSMYLVANFSDKNVENGHVYVDLGLSVKWATCNVGATSPDDYGNYFAWGETTGYDEGKTSFLWSNYSLCNGSNTKLKKYNTNTSYGSVDGKTVLESSYDAATTNWGGTWRMPTDEELTELRTSCTWKWTAYNDVFGYKVIGSNGNYIFLPAAGYRTNTSYYLAGSECFYWSSSLYTGVPDNAYYVCARSSTIYRDENSRCFGQSVRPVCP